MTMEFTTAYKRARKSASTSQRSLSATISKILFKSVLFISNADHIILNSRQVDSHMKPYSYKDALCQNLRFSSSACLLRYEREAHTMYGHGDKPHLYTHEGCERSILRNGFPRHWNLRDYMKRVHNDLILIKSTASRYTSVSSESIKGTKRKADSTDLDEDLKNSGTPLTEIGQLHESRLIKYYH